MAKDDTPEEKSAKAELRRVIAELDKLERDWKGLPDWVKAANPDLARWFADAPKPTKH